MCKSELLDFSVLMAVYKGDDSLLFDRALRSVFDNTLRPAEVVLVCDGSLSAELDLVLSGFSGLDTLRVFRLEHNVGLWAALNFGLSKIETEWVFRADADDVNVRDRFEKTMHGILKNHPVDVIGAFVAESSKEGVKKTVRSVPLTDKAIKQRMPWRNPFNHMTVAYKLSCVRDAGGYPNLLYREDYGLWAKLAGNGCSFANTSDIAVQASVTDGFYSRRGGLDYAKEEYRLQKLLLNAGVSNIVTAVISGLARATIFMLPASLRRHIYKVILRSRP